MDTTTFILLEIFTNIQGKKMLLLKNEVSCKISIGPAGLRGGVQPRLNLPNEITAWEKS